jgi:hypothetical protein
MPNDAKFGLVVGVGVVIAVAVLFFPRAESPAPVIAREAPPTAPAIPSAAVLLPTPGEARAARELVGTPASWTPDPDAGDDGAPPGR